LAPERFGVDGVGLDDRADRDSASPPNRTPVPGDAAALIEEIIDIWGLAPTFVLRLAMH
jgi:hypothetical protein